MVADEVVEGGQVEGVAGDVEPGGAGVLAGAGWRSVTCQDCFPCFSRSSAARGGLGDRVGDGGLDRLPAARGQPGESSSRTRRRRDRRWVAWATCRALYGSTASDSTSRQMRGSRCWRSRASAISFIPVSVATPSTAASGSGANAETAGVPSPPSDSSPSRSRPTTRRRPRSRSRCRRWRGATHHCAAMRSLPRSAARASSLRCRAPRAGRRVEVGDLDGLSAASVSNMCP